MSYESLLSDRCDIYHLKDRDQSGEGFGVPIKDRQKEYYYYDKPDLTNVSCYFTEKNQTIVQMEPNRDITQMYLVHFPIFTDIRINDRVVWEGVAFTAQKPRKIRGHHQEVILLRNESL